jgi:hypothetical protein
MRDFKYSFWNFLGKPIPIIIVMLLLWYVVGLFLSFNLNPLEWWFFRTGFGRLLSLIIFISIIYNAYD